MYRRIGIVSLIALTTGTAGSAGASSRIVATTPFASRATQDTAARIARLKRSFECLDVGTDGVFVCSMKDGMMGTLTRKRIEPVVTSSGTIFLRSVYRDRDWIYHDHVIVRIGDTEHRTAPVPATSPNVSRREVRRTSSSRGRNRGGGRDDYVSESVSYRGRGEEAIVQALAQAGDAEVWMQLAGGPRMWDKTLSGDEKRLFAEAWELAQLLRSRGER